MQSLALHEGSSTMSRAVDGTRHENEECIGTVDSSGSSEVRSEEVFSFGGIIARPAMHRITSSWKSHFAGLGGVPRGVIQRASVASTSAIRRRLRHPDISFLIA
jgi:hypothetical protein